MATFARWTLVLLLTARALSAQDPVETATGSAEFVLSQSAVGAQLSELTENEALPKEQRDLLIDLWSQALARVNDRDAALTRQANFEASSAQAPDELQTARDTLAQLPPASEPPDLSEVEGLELSELEKFLEEARQARMALDVTVRDQEAERSRRTTRLREIPNLISQARETLLGLESVDTSAATDEESLARRVLQSAGEAATRAQINALDAESQSFTDRRNLLTAQQDLTLRKQALAQTRETELLARVESLRAQRREAEARAAEAKLRESRFSHPALKKLAERENELGRLGVQLDTEIAETTRRLSLVEAESESVRLRRLSVEEKLEKLGFTKALGLLLRQHGHDLPDVRDARRSGQDVAALENLQVQLLELEEERSALTNLDGWLNERLADVDPEPVFADRASLEIAVRQEAITYRTRLDELLGLAQNRFEQLVSLDIEQRLLTNRVADYEAFINERVLWMPDTDVISSDDLKQLPGDFAWAFTAEAWAPIGSALALGASQHPWRDVLTLSFIVMLFVFRPLSHRRLRGLAEAAAKPGATITPTIRALMHTSVSAAILPAIVAAVGARMALHPEVAHVGELVVYVSVLLVPFSLMAALSLPAGLGEGHFGWPTEACKKLHSSTRRMLFLLVPLIVLLVLQESAVEEDFEHTLGRMGRILFMGGFGLYLHAMLRRSGPLEAVLSATRRKRPPIRLRPIAHLAGVLVPIGLIAMVLLGYSATESVMARHLVATSLLLMLLLLARGLSLRFLVLQRRRLERQAAEAHAEGQESFSVDVNKISEQARQLIGSALFVLIAVGTWWIWSDVLPALNFLEGVRLWEITDEVAIDSLDGGSSLVERVTGHITLANMVISLVVLALTAVAARNLPGLIDVAVLSRLELMPGTTYAVKSLVGYVLLLIGIAWALGNAGLSWSQLQWFVASMGVGLGFGLQEVFANFISGIILLFERPVRVGDVVTVGQTMGVITRIHMRATTIRDFNRRELLVPNRRFIADEVTNWTLSDAITRLVFSVDVSPGANKTQVKELLEGVAADVPEVLAEPGAYAICLGYDEGRLRFELRLYLSSFGERLAVTHAVNCGIDDCLSAAGIRVSAPRHEVHVQEYGGGLGDAARQATLSPEEAAGGRADSAKPGRG